MLKHSFQRLKRDFGLIYKLFLLLNCVALLSVLLPFNGLLPEIASSFILQYLFAGIIGIILSITNRDYVFALLGGLLVIGSYQLINYDPTNKLECKNCEKKVRLMLANVNSSNSRHEDFINLVLKNKPEVLAVLEMNEKWKFALEKLYTKYPYQIIQTREDNFGIALYSSLPLSSIEIKNYTNLEIPSIFTKVLIKNKLVDLFVTHPLPPMSEYNLSLRNLQMNQISSFVNKENPTIVIGDLNMSLWSKSYKQFEEKSSLRNIRMNNRILPTWPNQFPFLLTPIDHILFSKDFTVVNTDSEIITGSDHYALTGELAIN